MFNECSCTVDYDVSELFDQAVLLDGGIDLMPMPCIVSATEHCMASVLIHRVSSSYAQSPRCPDEALLRQLAAHNDFPEREGVRTVSFYYEVFRVTRHRYIFELLGTVMYIHSIPSVIG